MSQSQTSAKAILVDTTECMACRGCQVACKQWNNLPAQHTKNVGSYENPPALSPITVTMISFQEQVINGKFKWLFRKHQCMHCKNAPCLELCPSDAVTRNKYGFVNIIQEKCIGCGICEKFCPYDVPKMNIKTHKAIKCWMCLDRIENDLEPACVKTCPTNGLIYHKRIDLLKYAKKKAAKKKLHLYGENQLGGLHVLYLLKEDPQFYGLPIDPKMPDPFEAFDFLQQALTKPSIKKKALAMAQLKYFAKA